MATEETTTVRDLEFEPVSMGQALNVVANMVVSYITTIKPATIAADDAEQMKKLQQMAVAIVVHNIVAWSKHKLEMAAIIEAIAGDLRDKAAEEAGEANDQV
jgi:hypothetical protein